MKNCTQELAEHLNNDNEFICCDLFKLTLNDGSVYRIADSDKDIAFNGHLYKSDKFILQREQIKTAGAPSVETLTVTIYADREHDDVLSRTNLLQAAHEGKLDDGLNASVPLRTFAPQNVYQEADGVVSTASKDTYTCMIPLKPSKNVLIKL